MCLSVGVLVPLARTWNCIDWRLLVKECIASQDDDRSLFNCSEDNDVSLQQWSCGYRVGIGKEVAGLATAGAR